MELWILLGFLSAITYALADIISKKILTKYDTSPTQIMFEQHLFNILIILLVFFPFIDFTFFYDYFYIFLFKGFIVAGVAIVYFSLMKKYEVSVVSPLANLSPIILLIFTSTILGEHVTFFQIIGILITIVATYILEVNHHHHTKSEPHEFHFKQLFRKPSEFFIYAFLLLTMMSLTSILDKTLLDTGMGVYSNMYFTSVCVFALVSIYFITKGNFKDRLRKMVKEPETFSIGIIRFVDSLIILSALAIPGVLLSLLIPIRRTSTLFSAIGGGLLFHEKHMMRKIIAIVLMLVGLGFILV